MQAILKQKIQEITTLMEENAPVRQLRQASNAGAIKIATLTVTR